MGGGPAARVLLPGVGSTLSGGCGKRAAGDAYRPFAASGPARRWQAHARRWQSSRSWARGRSRAKTLWPAKSLIHAIFPAIRCALAAAMHLWPPGRPYLAWKRPASLPRVCAGVPVLCTRLPDRPIAPPLARRPVAPRAGVSRRGAPHPPASPPARTRVPASSPVASVAMHLCRAFLRYQPLAPPVPSYPPDLTVVISHPFTLFPVSFLPGVATRAAPGAEPRNGATPSPSLVPPL